MQLFLKHTFLLLICLSSLQNKAQNQSFQQKDKIAEFRVLFIQNVQFKSGALSTYKNINFNVNACFIEIKTIDFENSKDENITITLPINGAILKENGELYYPNKAIKETIENKITKKNTVRFYKNSKKIGLILKLENKEKQKIFQQKLIELSSYCVEEKKN